MSYIYIKNYIYYASIKGVTYRNIDPFSIIHNNILYTLIGTKLSRIDDRGINFMFEVDLDGLIKFEIKCNKIILIYSNRYKIISPSVTKTVQFSIFGIYNTSQIIDYHIENDNLITIVNNAMMKIDINENKLVEITMLNEFTPLKYCDGIIVGLSPNGDLVGYSNSYFIIKENITTSENNKLFILNNKTCICVYNEFGSKQVCLIKQKGIKSCHVQQFICKMCNQYIFQTRDNKYFYC